METNKTLPRFLRVPNDVSADEIYKRLKKEWPTWGYHYYINNLESSRGEMVTVHGDILHVYTPTSEFLPKDYIQVPWESDYQVGDVVKISDTGRQYTTYSTLAIKLNLTQYSYGGSMEVGESYEVCDVVMHTECASVIIYILKNSKGKEFISGSKYFTLIGTSGDDTAQQEENNTMRDLTKTTVTFGELTKEEKLHLIEAYLDGEEILYSNFPDIVDRNKRHYTGMEFLSFSIDTYYHIKKTTL